MGRARRAARGPREWLTHDRPQLARGQPLLAVVLLAQHHGTHHDVVGASNPVAANDTEAGRQQNRRTDIKVILNAP